jgi:hypothetical protein
MKRLLLAIGVLFILFFASLAADATINLTTSITVPNITRWQVIKYADADDDTWPHATIDVRIYGAGSTSEYRVVSILVCNTPCLSTTILKNSAPVSAMDRISTGTTQTLAYDTIQTAWDAATGRSNKRKAVEMALLSTGIVSADLTGTQN